MEEIRSALDAGVPLRDVQIAAGHADPAGGHVVLGLGAGLSSPFVDDLHLDVLENRPAEDRASSVALESSWSAAEPLLGIAGFIPGLGPVSLAVAAVAGLVFGRRALRQRRERALDGRREEARAHLRDYTGEVDRLVRRSVDRYASQLYRSLRDNPPLIHDPTGEFAPSLATHATGPMPT